MKIFFTIFAITILLTGCATKNAFSKLGMSEDQELAVENIKNGKLSSGNIVGGVFSAMYLNNIYPEMNDETVKFYISIYLKEKSNNLNIYIEKEIPAEKLNLSLKAEDLNSTIEKQSPIEVKQLSEKNEFSHLSPTKSTWNKNFLVSFENDKSSDVINLLIESDQFSSGQLSFSKDLR